jgi:hypothetical protein
LRVLYPHHDWDPLRFSTQVPRKYWSEEANQRAALEKVGRELLGVTKMEDWYSVSTRYVKKHLSFVNGCYGGSLFEALKRLYPEEKWDALRLCRVPQGYWQRPETEESVKRTIDEMMSKYNIRSLSDWYTLPLTEYKVFEKISRNIFRGKTTMFSSWFNEYKWAENLTGSFFENKMRVRCFIC